MASNETIASSYALIVASDQYTDPALSRLRAPAQDAERLAETLRNPAIGGFTVQSLINRPTQEVREKIEDFFADRKLDDLLVLYFSCHGVKDPSGQLYFATPTTRHNRLAATGISADFVNELMSRSRSRKIVLLLDCCYSGAFPHGLRPRSTEHVGVDRFEGRGRTVITASSSLEYAYETTGESLTGTAVPSVFTGALVDALQNGTADTDQDGLVSVDELYDYVFERVRETNPYQTPEKASNVRGELIIARNPQPPPARAEPVPVPADILHALDSSMPHIREGGVRELARLLRSGRPELATAVREKLEELRDDDSRLVSAAAAAALAETLSPPPQSSLPRDHSPRMETGPGRQRVWAIRHSLWILPALIGIGFFTWMSFLYIGIRAHRRQWIVVGIGYLIGITLASVLIGVDPGLQDSDPNTSGPAGVIGVLFLLAIWLGGILHALITNPIRLRHLASSDSPWPQAPSQPMASSSFISDDDHRPGV
jgi:hypothetical protein